ncbi:zinc-binding protein A33-like [Hypanus sabinus]|uniref:zinc-binding protein A33-like n=1 Tax=Hypanus sabinus TaxID=79690 RepID=UPI0028C4A465|nr:zinc-binding protein A33-like [Hypanus sabinus]
MSLDSLSPELEPQRSRKKKEVSKMDQVDRFSRVSLRLALLAHRHIIFSFFSFISLSLCSLSRTVLPLRLSRHFIPSHSPFLLPRSPSPPSVPILTPAPALTLLFFASVPTLLTLDPKTANAHLILSRDGTEVRVGDKQEDIPDNPERFSRWLSVLGAEGFNSGKHCWEVEVGDSTVWQVGVAKASVPRKRGFAPFHWQESRKFFAPEPQAGVWALALQDGDYTALTSPPIELRLKGKLRKLGVYLDYPAGQVSFYNADDVYHLYTFKDKFIEEIFPYFYIAHKGDSLRLTTLGI